MFSNIVQHLFFDYVLISTSIIRVHCVLQQLNGVPCACVTIICRVGNHYDGYSNRPSCILISCVLTVHVRLYKLDEYSCVGYCTVLLSFCVCCIYTTMYIAYIDVYIEEEVGLENWFENIVKGRGVFMWCCVSACRFVCVFFRLYHQRNAAAHFRSLAPLGSILFNFSIYFPRLSAIVASMDGQSCRTHFSCETSKYPQILCGRPRQ